MRDYCIGMISSRWRAKDANVCGAAGLQHRPEIGAYCSRRYRKKRQALVPRALRTAQFNYGTFRKRPRNHIGALAGGITAYSLLFTGGRLIVTPRDATKKQAPGIDWDWSRSRQLVGRPFSTSKKPSPFSLENMARKPSYVSIAGRHPSDSSLVVSTIKSPATHSHRRLWLVSINAIWRSFGGMLTSHGRRPCALYIILNISGMLSGLWSAMRYVSPSVAGLFSTKKIAEMRLSMPRIDRRLLKFPNGSGSGNDASRTTNLKLPLEFRP